MTEEIAPLDPIEERFLRAFARVLVTVPRALDEQLTRETPHSLTDYFALMHLSEAPGRSLRMGRLAEATDLSLSGMTRIVARLEQAGLVRRERGVDDGRSWVATLTDAGLARLREMWPRHLAGVREILFDQLDGAALEDLADRLERVAEAAGGGCR